MKTIEQEELIRIFEQFLNERSMWFDFKDFIEEQGYSVEELGFSNED